MKNCPSCGAPLTDSDTFCGNCGAKTEASQTVTFEDPIKGFNPDNIRENPAMQYQPTQQMGFRSTPQMQSTPQTAAQMQSAPQMQTAPQMQGAPQMQYQDPQMMQGAGSMAMQNPAMQPMQNQASQPVQFQPGQYQQGQPVYQQNFYEPNPQAGLITAIKIFLVFSCIFSSWLVFPLLWKIPMTVVAFKKMDQRDPLGLGFKICSLLFVGVIPGILMLALNDDLNYRTY